METILDYIKDATKRALTNKHNSELIDTQLTLRENQTQSHAGYFWARCFQCNSHTQMVLSRFVQLLRRAEYKPNENERHTVVCLAVFIFF